MRLGALYCACPASSTRADVTDNRAIYPNSQVPRYERLEVTFQVGSSVATNLQMPFDTAPPPGVEPGAVIDYSWVERRTNALTNNVELSLQREVPVRVLRYHIKPLRQAAEAGWSIHSLK